MLVFFNRFLISFGKIVSVGIKLFWSDLSEAKKSITFRLKSLSCRHRKPTPPSKIGWYKTSFLMSSLLNFSNSAFNNSWHLLTVTELTVVWRAKWKNLGRKKTDGMNDLALKYLLRETNPRCFEFENSTIVHYFQLFGKCKTRHKNCLFLDRFIGW